MEGVRGCAFLLHRERIVCDGARRPHCSPQVDPPSAAACIPHAERIRQDPDLKRKKRDEAAQLEAATDAPGARGPYCPSNPRAVPNVSSWHKHPPN